MTDFTTALTDLFSDDPDVRLRAARFLAQNPRSQDAEVLKRAYQSESVHWISRALERALARIEYAPSPAPSVAREVPDAPKELVRALHAKAVEEVSGTIIHEFSAVVGPLLLRAEQDVPNFAASETAKLLNQLKSLMAAVRNIKRAAGVPSYTEFDLVELVREVIEACGPYENIQVSLPQSGPFPIRADRDQLKIAISNGLRNAKEAVLADSRVQPPTIILNWGRAGAENWLAIIDSGPGFSGSPTAALKFGATTKENHIGFGLATSLQAMQSMEGDVLLSNTTDGGARFELRWYRNADPIRRGQ